VVAQYTKAHKRGDAELARKLHLQTGDHPDGEDSEDEIAECRNSYRKVKLSAFGEHAADS
jgi:hypothetical protein